MRTLAQAGGRDLDGDNGLGDAVHCELVVATQIALGQRTLWIGRPPYLHQIRVGEDVEQTGARRLAERLEVTPPDILGAARLTPDAPLIHIQSLIAEKVNGADDIVEVARVQQVGNAILRARYE